MSARNMYQYSPIRNPYNVTEHVVTHERLSWFYSFFCSVTMTNIILSIIDLLLSFSEFDCKNTLYPTMSLTLGTWLQVSSIYGLFYSISMILSVFYLIQWYEYSDQNSGRKYHYILKILYVIFTVGMLIWSVIGIYIFTTYYWSICNVTLIVDYLWIRLGLGILSNTAFFVTTICSTYLVADHNIRSYFYNVYTD